MIKCNTVHQYQMCQWILSFFDEDAIQIELVDDNEIKVTAQDDYILVYVMVNGNIECECFPNEKDRKSII